MKKRWFDPNEEPFIVRRLFHTLQYHIYTQQLLSSRRIKERIIVWVTIVGVIVTAWFAIGKG